MNKQSQEEEETGRRRNRKTERRVDMELRRLRVRKRD